PADRLDVHCELTVGQPLEVDGEREVRGVLRAQLELEARIDAGPRRQDELERAVLGDRAAAAVLAPPVLRPLDLPGELGAPRQLRQETDEATADEHRVRAHGRNRLTGRACVER